MILKAMANVYQSSHISCSSKSISLATSYCTATFKHIILPVEAVATSNHVYFYAIKIRDKMQEAIAAAARFDVHTTNMQRILQRLIRFALF